MNSERWLSEGFTHEGFPLRLRRPAISNYDQLQGKYPRLIVITHHLAKVRPDGMPEPDYNSGLADLDHELLTRFAKNKRGRAVLVETFGGRRDYWVYSVEGVAVESEVAKIRARFPDAKLTCTIESDPAWKFIRRYAGQFWPAELAMQFPDDDNGDVLRNMQRSGMDFGKSYDIEFFHVFADRKRAQAMANAAKKLGHKAEVQSNEEKSGWDCMVVVHMKPTHEGITATERSLGKIAAEHAGKGDGWGLLHE